MDEWIKYTNTRDCYATITKKEILLFVTTWMDLEALFFFFAGGGRNINNFIFFLFFFNLILFFFKLYNVLLVLPNIILSEVSQTEKDKYCVTSLICGI